MAKQATKTIKSTKTIEAIKEKNYGSILWFESAKYADLSVINTALQDAGFSDRMMPTSSWAAFKVAWHRFATPIKNAKNGWLTRRLEATSTSEKVAVIRETHNHSSEKLELQHEFEFYMNGPTDQENLYFKCSCGHVEFVTTSIPTFCPSCSIEYPSICAPLVAEFALLSSQVGSEGRGYFIRNIMRREGVIALAQQGRPFFHPNFAGSRLETFFKALNNWGDRAVVIPLGQNEEVPKLAFEALVAEINELSTEAETWGENTRDATRDARIKALDEIKSKLDLYSELLGDFTVDVLSLVDSVKETMMGIVLGNPEKRADKEAKAQEVASRKASREAKRAEIISAKKAKLAAQKENIEKQLNTL